MVENTKKNTEEEEKGGMERERERGDSKMPI